MGERCICEIDGKGCDNMSCGTGVRNCEDVMKITRSELCSAMMLLEMSKEEAEVHGITKSICKCAAHSILQKVFCGSESYPPTDSILDAISSRSIMEDEICSAHSRASGTE